MIFKLLNSTKKPCNPINDYSFDGCNEEKIKRISLQKFNCSNPFGKDKENICTDPEKVKESFKLTRHSNRDHATSSKRGKDYVVLRIKLEYIERKPSAYPKI